MIRNFLMTTAAVVALTGTAFAADLPSRKAPPVYAAPAPIFTWTGVYLGGHVGYQWGSSSSLAVFVPTGAAIVGLPSYSPNGVVGGAHVGYNWQVANFVFGLEGDVDGTSYKGSNTAGLTYTTRIDVEGSIRGRVGIAWDRALFYATGGGAFAGIRNTYSFGGSFVGIGKTRAGYTVGGGIEYAVTPNWSVRGEYRYTNFGHYNDIRKGEADHSVRVGFSYKFDTYAPPAPVVAKY